MPCRRDLARLWREQRSIVLWVCMGLGIFLLRGFGAELIKGHLYAGGSPEVSFTLAGQNLNRLFWIKHLRVTVEAFAELLGETIILFGVAQFVLKSLSPQVT